MIFSFFSLFCEIMRILKGDSAADVGFKLVDE